MMKVLNRLRSIAGIVYAVFHVGTITNAAYELGWWWCKYTSSGNEANQRNRYTGYTSWHGQFLFRIFCWICGIKVRYHLQPGIDFANVARSALFMANHGSYLDTPLMCAVLQLLKRTRPRWFMKEEMARWPVFGKAGRRTNCAFLHRSSHPDDRESVARCVDSARAEGADIVQFPSGTRLKEATFEAEYGLAGVPHFGGFKWSLMRLPGAPVIDVTICWRKGVLMDPLQVGGEELDIYVEYIPREVIDQDPERWFFDRWRGKNGKLKAHATRVRSPA